jgi:hypothetical protein
MPHQIMPNPLRFVFLTLVALVLTGVVAAQPSAAPNDYSDPHSWLCRPNSQDACDVDLTTTVIAPGGALTREKWERNGNAPIDCFYVYPTVSTDTTPNSDMTPDAAELNVMRQQFARFGSVCSTYAPSYRQITLAGLRRIMSGGGAALDHGLQYDDVRDAWNYYLQHDNKDRPFVLVAHSQGSFILQRLIAEEIDGKPVQARMVSAILAGATLSVPRGKDVGGTFQHVPLCRSATQTGCVIAYSSFRSTIPPPANTLFGKTTAENMTAACTNPAALAGGSGELHAYLSTTGSMIVGTTVPKAWVTPEAPISTPWVSAPGMLTGECKSNEYATYLEVTVHADPSGHRSGDIVGDISAGDKIQANWGLHLVDMNLAMGNLVDLVGQQSKAWSRQNARARTKP